MKTIIATSVLLFSTYAAQGSEDFTYYVDSSRADDTGNGLTPATAWKTAAKVNATTLRAGQSVGFKRGGVWRETLTPTQSGSAGNPITFGAYGAGAKPSIRASNLFDSAGLWANVPGSSLWYASGIPSDPGVFAHSGSLGSRKISKGSLASQWDYWYDSSAKRLYVYSAVNPTTVSTGLEIAVRARPISGNGLNYVTYRGLDVRHSQAVNTAFLLTAGGNYVFEDCDLSQFSKYGIQVNGAGAVVFSRSSVIDWGVVDGQQYAIQAIASAGSTSGPVDILDSTFTINHNANQTEVSLMSDKGGWFRNVLRNTFTNNGTWKGSGVYTWRPGPAATSITISDNRFYRMGNAGVAIQELTYNGASPIVRVQRNYIEDSNQSDSLDTEGLRVRGVASGLDVEVSYNVINRCKGGANNHAGIYLYDVVGARIFNNTVAGCDDGILLKAASTGNDIRNNIFSGNRTYGIRLLDTSSTAVFNHNAFNQNTSGNYSGIAQGVGDVLADPLFTNAAAGDFTLQPGSPAVGVGASTSQAPNIGAK